MTDSYTVQVQEIDKHANMDPTEIDANIVTGVSSTQFKQTHPSLYLPKHQYRKYKMKDGRNRTGLNVIKEKPLDNQQFAIMHLMKRDIAARAASQSLEEEETEIKNTEATTTMLNSSERRPPMHL